MTRIVRSILPAAVLALTLSSCLRSREDRLRREHDAARDRARTDSTAYVARLWDRLGWPQFDRALAELDPELSTVQVAVDGRLLDFRGFVLERVVIPVPGATVDERCRGVERVLTVVHRNREGLLVAGTNFDLPVAPKEYCEAARDRAAATGPTVVFYPHPDLQALVGREGQASIEPVGRAGAPCDFLYLPVFPSSDATEVASIHCERAQFRVAFRAVVARQSPVTDRGVQADQWATPAPGDTKAQPDLAAAAQVDLRATEQVAFGVRITIRCGPAAENIPGCGTR